MSQQSRSEPAAEHTAPADGMRTFIQVLANTMIANVTTSFLWFALTFWAYLETKSVLATAWIGGAYMLLIAVFSIFFGTIVDRHRKHRVMMFSGVITLVSFGLGGVIFLLVDSDDLIDLGQQWFWVFGAIILIGAVVENMRNIALSTTVTLLVPVQRHANANGMVGTVQGLSFLVTSVFSGLSIGLLGMGWTLVIAIVFTGLAMLHLLFIRIPESEPSSEEGHSSAIDLRGSIGAIRAIPGLPALIFFSTFNNLIGGVYLALMDPYGLTLFSVEVWGFVLALSSTGFIIGGAVISKFGLGRNPVRTMLAIVVVMGLLGAIFTLREWAWLYIAGIWAYMMLVPAVEAAEQTVIQKVVPFRRQGRVFGVAQALESAAAPVTAFLIAPIAQFFTIPYMRSDAGQRAWGGLLGDGQARGIALVFLVAGLIMVIVGILAFFTRSYRTLSTTFAGQTGSVPAAEPVPGDLTGDIPITPSETR